MKNILTTVFPWKRFLLIPYLIGALGATTNVQAQQSDSSATIGERVAKLEKVTSQLPKISGFINMRYRYSDADDGSNSFDIRRARLNFKGDLSPSLDYRLQVEFANSPKILDAYIRWKIDEYFNIEAGQFKIPFSLENPYSPANLEVIDNSLIITALSSYADLSGVASNGRDVGLSAYGGFGRLDGFNLIEYHLGVFNGAGINAGDKNKSKDFSGILSLRPIKELILAVSHYNGQSGAADATHQRVRTGVGVKYDNGKLLLRSEYIQGKTGLVKSDGVYAVLGWFVTPRWQPVVKYDYFRPDKSVGDAKQSDYLAGINYLPVKNIKLQLNYTYKTIAGAKDINYVAAQVFALF